MDKELYISQVKAVQNALRSFLLALCNGNKADADDIAQDTLIKAYIAIDSYTDEGKFKSWIFRIAYNSFLNHAAARRQYNSLDEVETVAGNYPADFRFEHQHLYLALSTLPPRERSAITLYYLNGYSIKDIAVITDCSQDAVKKQLSRGRDKLRETINYDKR